MVTAAPVPAFSILERLLTHASGALASLPGSVLEVAPPPSTALLLVAAGWLSRLVCRSWRPAALLWIAGALLWAIPRESPSRAQLTATVLDVGHGLATVIETSDRQALVFDAGSADRQDVAESILVPFLRSRGLGRVHTLVLSHGDQDHVGAARELAASMPVGRVLVSPYFVAAPGGRVLCRDLRAAGATIVVVGGGEVLRLGNARIRIVHPGAQGPLLLPLSGNDASIAAVVIAAEGGRILLCGDLEESGILELTRGGPIRADALLLPHHGNRVENLGRLLDAVGPQVAVASRSERFPFEPSRRECLAHGSWVLETSRSGAIQLSLEAHVRTETFLKR